VSVERANRVQSIFDPRGAGSKITRRDVQSDVSGYEAAKHALGRITIRKREESQRESVKTHLPHLKDVV